VTAYCTIADLLLQVREVEILQLADDSDDGSGTISDPEVVAVISRAIAKSSARIDAVAGAYYSVPFEATPDFIRDLAVDMTLVHLAERRNGAPKWAETTRERVKLDLEQLAEGKLTTGDQPEPGRNTERLGSGTTEDRVFTTDTLKGF